MKRLLMCFTIVLMVFTAYAAPVNREEASALAATFLNQRSVNEVKTSFDHFYVYNGKDCFVILSADDHALPVLGYSRKHVFDVDDIPVNAQEWLRAYNYEIQTLAERGADASERVKEAWTSLRNGGGLPQRGKGSVSPLIATYWNQRAPYDGLCPTDCYTGCVATAMAQLMKYWEYPRRGTGDYSYFHSTYGDQYANFGATTYDWDNMPVVARAWSPEPVCQALSTLFYHCGVSVDMNYGTTGSSAASAKVPIALVNHFGYAGTAQLVYQMDYSYEGWEDQLRSELNAERPMYYAGQSDKGAHAFICDGYDEMGFFHFNWGWGGKDDGFYKIGALDPASQGSYNVLNYAIVGIEPYSYAIAAPEGLSASVEGEHVVLSWTAVSGAVLYKVYRDGVMISPMVMGTSYTDDNMSYGAHTYYVKAVSSMGDRSPRSTAVEVNVESHVQKPVRVDVVPQGNDLVISWEMPFGSEEELSYGTGNQVSSMGYNERDTYWGQRYPAVMLKDYVGFSISSVSVYLKESGNYTLYLCQGNEVGVTDVVFQGEYSVESGGWWNLLVDDLSLDYTRDLWVVLCAPAEISYPAAYCSYNGLGMENASFISTALSTFISCANREISWMMAVNLEEEGDFTYKVLRNGTLVASELTERSFTDTGLTSGAYEYQVWSKLNGVESEEPAQNSITVATIDLAIDHPDAGVLSGGGLAEIGEYHTVSVVPNAGKVFLGWKENGVMVSSNRDYSFLVVGDCSLTACFSGTGVEEEEDSSAIRKIEVFAINGVLLETITEDFSNYKHRLDGYARGMYLLRITTDEGVITKKMGTAY